MNLNVLYKKKKMVEDLLCLDAHDFLQDILNYGSAILVAAESIGDRKHGDWALENPLPKWLILMQTTRKLIAHNTVFPNQAMILRNTIANNIRNLYRLFGIDLADTKSWRSVQDNTSHFMAPNEELKIGFEMGVSPPDTLLNLQSISFEDLQADFDLGHYKKTEQLVGHCIFVIVATRNKYWEEQMKAYRMMIS
jgi:hypothetical protein